MRFLPVQPYLSSLAPDAEERVARNLANTERGRLKDWTSPLIPDKDDPRGGRLQRIAEVSDWLYPTGYEWLDEAEHDQELMIGPWSIQLPYRERKRVYDYFQQMEINPNPDAIRYAYTQVSRLVQETLRPVSLETAYADMPTGTNLGLPFASKDVQYREMVLELARAIRRSDFVMEPDPALLFWRGQARGLDDDPKQRDVWGYSHYLILFELMLQIPLLNYLRRRRIEFAAWVSPSAVDEAVTYVIENCKQDILSVDFSRFDASVPDVLIRMIFRILKNWFGERWTRQIEYVENAFLNVGLLTPEGIIVDRHGGVPSGSGLTNLIDSLIQLLAFKYISYRMKNEIDVHLVQGDDGVICFNRSWNLEEVSGLAAELGLKLSSDKGGVSKDRVYFLQNIHSRDRAIDGYYKGVRPVMRVMNGAFSYERFHDGWTGADDSLRWMQQFNNLQNHPKFREAVRFLWDNDKYLRRYSIAELIDKAGGPEQAESVLELKAFSAGKMQLEDYPSSPIWKEVMLLKSGKVAPYGPRRM